MKYIPREKLKLYLKMGRELSQFISIGQYFDSVTFDWVRMTGSEQNAKIELIRSVDEGDDYYCDVTLFSTIGEIDPEEIKEYIGSLDNCLAWLESELGGSPDKFVGKGMIDQEYEEYVESRE
ncbi:hypothetical protein [Shewanella sp. NFH-SH190041]|uniref:hypothetical protein n=1 Tax=Shewanella sp. NFH-SH190041 TaxID=2950245 RepID=UPI0021C4503A|nr:hypothetical protein [Shewanella sp. NFH-SH190041]